MDVEDQLRLCGTVLESKYRIEAAIATGGFAIVYRATHIVWNRPVAVKVFSALADLPESSRAKLLDEFVQEGALLSELSARTDAAIVQAATTWASRATPDGDKVPYMILEWLDGASLTRTFSATSTSRGCHLAAWAEVVAMLEPVAEALALAHRKGIAHRDGEASLRTSGAR